MKYIDIISKRRSIYDLNKNILISESELNDLIISATKYTPSAFNSQTSRLIVLTKEKHGNKTIRSYDNRRKETT